MKMILIMIMVMKINDNERNVIMKEEMKNK